MLKFKGSNLAQEVCFSSQVNHINYESTETLIYVHKAYYFRHDLIYSDLSASHLYVEDKSSLSLPASLGHRARCYPAVPCVWMGRSCPGVPVHSEEGEPVVWLPGEASVSYAYKNWWREKANEPTSYPLVFMKYSASK